MALYMGCTKPFTYISYSVMPSQVSNYPAYTNGIEMLLLPKQINLCLPLH